MKNKPENRQNNNIHHEHQFEWVKIIKTTYINQYQAVYYELWRCKCGTTKTTSKVEYI